MKKTIILIMVVVAMLPVTMSGQCSEEQTLFAIDLNLSVECFDELPMDVYGYGDEFSERAFLSIFDLDSEQQRYVAHFPDITSQFVQIQTMCLTVGHRYMIVVDVSESCNEWDDIDDLTISNAEIPEGGGAASITLSPRYLNEPGDALFISKGLLQGVVYEFVAFGSNSLFLEDCSGDLNGDRVVNSGDLLIILSIYGQSCP